jgi:hypothetical protein
MAELCEPIELKHVFVDGKSTQHSANAMFTGSLHQGTLGSPEQLILDQRSVPEGGHEITAVPDLLESLNLEGGGNAGRSRMPEGDSRADPGTGRKVDRGAAVASSNSLEPRSGLVAAPDRATQEDRR